MKSSSENWSLPWHALQKNLAQAFAAESIGRTTAARLSAHRQVRKPASKFHKAKGANSMSGLDVDMQARMGELEVQWRQAYEASIIARSDYQSLAASPKSTAALLDFARERLDRAEALKARIMSPIERLEDHWLAKS
jgi:hypothetical protein